MKNILLAIATFYLISSGQVICAQETVSASGGNISGSGGTVSYSVGQVIYTVITDLATGTVSQGVQQPYEISVITEIEEIKNIDLICQVYPNPANDFLTLKIENYDTGELIYKLFDSNGKLLKDRKTEGNETIISMSGLLPAVYFLKVTDNGRVIRTFKIIKN